MYNFTTIPQRSVEVSPTTIYSINLINQIKSDYRYAPNVTLEAQLPAKRMQQITLACDKAFRAQCRLTDAFRDLNFLARTSGNCVTIKFVAELYGRIQTLFTEFKRSVSELKVSELTAYYRPMWELFAPGMLSFLKRDVIVLYELYNAKRLEDVGRWPDNNWDPIELQEEEVIASYVKGTGK